MTEKSAAACAVTSWLDQLYVAWTGTDLCVNVIASPHWGEFAGKLRLPERSYKRVTRSSSSMSSSSTGSGRTSSSTTETIALAPSLAGSGERLYIAWTGTDGALNVAAGEPGAGGKPTTFRERTAYSPSLAASGGGGLTLAWTGTDTHVNLIPVAQHQPGGPFQLTGPKNTFDLARTGQAPAVCRHRDGTALAWTGTDRHVNILVNADDPACPLLRLEQARSSSRPALCSHRGVLAVAWTGSDRRVNVLTSAVDPARPPLRLEQAKTSAAPALCSHRDTLILGWTGSDRRPNLARLP
ncbi:MAG TPA: hypothetical protein VGF32_26790 [Streptosporangiaceae bacterium]